VEGSGSEIRQRVELSEETSGRLNRMPCSRIAACQRCSTQLSDPTESLSNAADENLAAADGSAVFISRAVEGDTEDTFVPGFALG
jgi:hypothetical protein